MVTDEFDAFLACGILAHGFLRLRCDGCAEEKLVAFSCKRRGICPSCGTRRMAEAAAHLVDHVIPKVPVRQWVLSLPIPLRILFAVHPDLLLPVLQIFHRAIATTVSASDPLSWGAGTECEAAKSGGAGAAADCDHTGARRRLRAYADRQRAVAHDLGALVETRSWNCDIDIEQCPQCGGQLKLIAAIEEPAAIQRIRTHLGLAARPPPRAPARRVDRLQAA